MVIGLTGGIASGKSLVAEYFRAAGVPVIDTDDLAREVVAPGQPAWQRLRETFPPDCFLSDGQVARAALATLVFADPTARRVLEAITHPAIYAEVDRQVSTLQHASPPAPLIVVVVPLLFETGAEARFDLIVVVYARDEQVRARLTQQRGYTLAEAEARIAAQLPLAEKLHRADYLLDNTGTPEQTRAQVAQLLDRLR